MLDLSNIKEHCLAGEEYVRPLARLRWIAKTRDQKKCTESTAISGALRSPIAERVHSFGHALGNHLYTIYEPYASKDSNLSVGLIRRALGVEDVKNNSFGWLKSLRENGKVFHLQGLGFSPG